MSTTEEAVKFEILPKRETRTKKHITFDAKDPGNNNKNQRQKPAEGKSGSGAKEPRRGRGGKKAPVVIADDDDSENQGFTTWLRSSDGVDTMRLFVIANSILVLVTMAWPHISQMFGLIRESIFGEDE